MLRFCLALVVLSVVVWSASAGARCPPDSAPLAATGPYVAFRGAAELVFVSGQIGTAPAAAPAPAFADQVQTALARLERVLTEAGSGPGEILRTTVYLTDPADIPVMNALYRRFFESRNLALPARSLVPGLDFGNAIRFEIDAIARRPACD